MTKAPKRDDPQTTPDIRAVVRLIMACCTAADAPLIRGVLGGASVPSIPRVAAAFEVAETTVRNTWRRDGMPGKAARGPGQRGEFIIADIAIWLLERADTAERGRARARGYVRDDATRRELDNIEIETARLRLAREQRKDAIAAGEVAEIPLVRAEIAEGLGFLRDELLQLPAKIKPILPSRSADAVTVEIDRIIRHELTALSEKTFVKGENGRVKHGAN